MKTLAPALLLLCGLTGCVSLPKPEESAVRLVFKDDATCSGTAVGLHTLLSAEHCFSDKSGEMSVNDKITEYLITARDGWDHVLVWVGLKQSRPAKIGKAPKPGDTVVIIGNPHGLRYLWRRGIVAGAWESDPCPFPQWPSCKLTLMDINTTSGDSGAGYYDVNGNVIAVNAGFVEFHNGWHISATFPLAFTKQQLDSIR